MFESDYTKLPTKEIRDFVLQHDPCQPEMKFPDNAKGRHFSVTYYFMRTATGQSIRRTWLCYSPSLQKVYCENCWLFGDRGSPHFRPEWVNGIDDWQHLTQKIVRHETSITHIQAMKSRMDYSENKTILAAMDKQIIQEADRWKQVLRRIFKVILSLCSSNNALRGHKEKIHEINPGNFLREIKLLADFDPILRELIHNDKQKVKYLSPLVQNEIIQILSAAVRKQICNEVQKVKYYSIIMDSTTDISKIEQVSIILRYCLFDDIEKKVMIKESFLGFFELSDRSANGYEELIMKVLTDLKLDFSLCRGQGYDGASVMSGAHKGLQAKLKCMNEKATYVHCAAHKLNLVLTDAVRSKAIMANFFDTIQSIYAFFHSSGIRWNDLENILKQSDLLKPKKETITIKRVCETRWEARHAAVLALKMRYSDILKALTKIILTSNKRDEVAEAKGLQKRIENFQFINILVFWEKILRCFHVLSKKLQLLEITTDECVLLWENGIKSLDEIKLNMQSIKDEALQTAIKWGIQPVFETSRKIKKTRFHDGIGVDTARKSLLSESSLFEASMMPVLDCVIFQMKSRFEGTKDIFNFFQFLFPLKFLNMEENSLAEQVDRFCQKYNDVDSSLLCELLNLKLCMKSELLKITSIRELLELLIKYNLREAFPNLVACCVLFLTIPVSVASAERSFSKLKLIKNYLRSTMLEERLSGMALLSIESERAHELNIDSMIDTFANNKARRRQF